MADAVSAHLEVIGDVVLAGKFAQALCKLGALDVLVGHEVVGHEHDAVLVEDLLDAFPLKHGYGRGRRYVMPHEDIYVRLHNLPGPDRVPAAVGGEYLFRYGHFILHGYHL